MGRLMDSVMAALGQKPSDRVQISSSAPEKSMENKISQQKPEDKPLSPEMEKLIEEMENQPQNKQIGDRSIFSFVSKPPSSLNAKDNREKPENKETDRKNVGELAADVEKKEENAKDCFGCKAVSVGAATFGCGYGLYVAKVNPSKVEGLRLTSTRIGGIVLAMVCAGMGLLQIFDLNPRMTEEEVKAIKGETLLEQINFELNYLGDILGIRSKSDKKLDDASKDTNKS